MLENWVYNMDMRKLLEAVTKFAGEPEQKAGDQVRGKEKATPTKSDGEHPFKGRLVGGESKDPSLLQDLSKLSEEMTTEWKLAEMWANFNEDDIGTHPKRPARKSDRPAREYTKAGKPSKRYNTIKQDTEESRGHKVLATKLGNMERMKNVQIPTPAERKQQELDRIAREKGNQDKEQVKEYGATANAGAAQTTATGGLPDAAKKAMAATTSLKAATGTPAPANSLMKALDVASQGKPIDATSAKVLEPMMDVVKQAASDPKLANQFKTLANQARTLTQQQAAEQNK